MDVADAAGFSRFQVFALVARLSIVTAIGFFSMKWIMSRIDPVTKSQKKAKEKVLLDFFFHRY